MLIPEKDRVHWENQILNEILWDDARNTDASKQTVHNPEKTNMDTPWIEEATKREIGTTLKYQRHANNKK